LKLYPATENIIKSSFTLYQEFEMRFLTPSIFDHAPCFSVPPTGGRKVAKVKYDNRYEVIIPYFISIVT
jgi:hypothetical protein